MSYWKPTWTDMMWIHLMYCQHYTSRATQNGQGALVSCWIWTHCLLTATRSNDHKFLLIYAKKKSLGYMNCHISQPGSLGPFFCVLDFRFLIALFIYRDQDRIQQNSWQYLPANLWVMCMVALDIDWSWNIHNFCSKLIEHIVDFRKMRRWELEI